MNVDAKVLAEAISEIDGQCWSCVLDFLHDLKSAVSEADYSILLKTVKINDKTAEKEILEREESRKNPKLMQGVYITQWYRRLNDSYDYSYIGAEETDKK